MSTGDLSELTEVLDRVKSWSPESRIVLARRILESLESARPAAGVPSIRSVRDLIGLGAGDSPTPDDETVRRWVDGHRMEKHG